MRLTVDKIASATRNVPIRRDIRIHPAIVAREGYLVAGRIRGEKTVYNQLEDLHGRMVTLHADDIIVGVLGPRNALQGYSGYVPEALQAGETLQLLNLGGVIGRCTSQNPDVGPPFDVELLGAVLIFPDFENRAGVPAHIGMNAIPWEAPDAGPVRDVPVVFIAGTCMNSGKTSAACQLIRQLDQRGIAVGGCKLTGVSLRRDTLNMLDFGAQWAVSFNEAGIVSTTAGPRAVGVAQGLIRYLARQGAQVIVAELGDGILGEYGVQDILAASALQQSAAAIVMCANDPVGAWGARRVMEERFGLTIDIISGPATDNSVGVRFIQEQLQLAAINARTHGAAFGTFIYEHIRSRLPSRLPAGAAGPSGVGISSVSPSAAGDHAVEADV